MRTSEISIPNAAAIAKPRCSKDNGANRKALRKNGTYRTAIKNNVAPTMPLYCQGRNGFLDVMRHAIALNGSFFNTHRMLQQYVVKAYL